MTDRIDPTETRPAPRRRRWWITGLIGTVVLAGGIYGIRGGSGNFGLGGDPGPCGEALSLASRLKPEIRGEVAALVPAAQPLLLSQLAFQREDGSRTTLADWSGRLVLFNLWATWCAPCRAEMPALDRLQAAVGSKEFEVVTVDVDTTGPEKPKRFLAEIGVQALAFRSDPTLGVFKALQKTGRSRGLPTTILIDGKGCEIATMYGPAQWDSPEAQRLIRTALAR